MGNDKEIKNQMIKYLSNEKNIHEPLIQRKETASWSFIIFYVATIWTIYNIFLDNKPPTFTIILSFFVVVLLGYIAFQFVHSQYASIHYWNAYRAAINKTIIDLMEENFRMEKLPWDEKQNMPNFLSKQVSENKKKVQPFLGEKHPLKILLRFWLYWLFKFLWEKKGIKEVEKLGNPKEYLRNPAKQEASLYSIIILVTLTYCYLISIWLFILLVFFLIWYFFRILKEITKMDLNQLLDKLVI